MRINKGSVNYRTSTLQDREDVTFSYGEEKLDLSAKNREIDFEAVYKTSLGEYGNVDTNVLYRLNPYHNSKNKDEASILMKYNISF